MSLEALIRHRGRGITYAEDYGLPANDTGTVDRTAALQDAVDNAQGVLVLPPGLFRIAGSAITMDQRHGLTITGSGAYDDGEGTCFIIDKADCTLFDINFEPVGMTDAFRKGKNNPNLAKLVALSINRPGTRPSASTTARSARPRCSSRQRPIAPTAKTTS